MLKLHLIATSNGERRKAHLIAIPKQRITHVVPEGKHASVFVEGKEDSFFVWESFEEVFSMLDQNISEKVMS